ncbi:MAG: WD40/YVTN/BNR-like repeat-containing protein, partial [Thermomicrobiales bacterium]
MVDAILGTNAGGYRLAGGELEPLGLTDERISAVFAERLEDGRLVLLAGSYGNGLFRSEDGGRDWTPVREGLTAPAFRTIVPDPFERTAILCGTEPARIFRSVDGGLSWQERAGIRALAGYEDWYLPYSPRAGAVRNVYAPPGGRRLLAAVEVGGLLDSHDAGDTWSYLPVLGDPDIHHITGHPDDPDLLFASLGWASLKNEQRGPDAPALGGVARSRDGGRTWEKFHTDYTRAS